jgi:ribosome-binding protein aMBF1 (putative translation factor)
VARIANVRKHLEISQRQLAATSGLSRDVVRAVEAGERHLQFDEAAALCRVLGIDLAEVVADAPLVLRTEVVFD